MTETRKPDFALLLAAVRPQPDVAAMRHCAGMMTDWGRLTALAHAHAVAPLLLRGLRMADLPVPDDLKDSADTAARHSLALAGALVQVSGALAAAGVRYLTFKGPSESVLAYGNPSLRSFRDIDLIVDPADVPAAVAVLEAQGYQAIKAGAARLPPDLAQMLLLRRETRTAIDLHWRWTELPDLFDWPFAEACGRRITVDIAGTPVCALPDEERFLFLCLHGGLHFWDRLVWLCDLGWEYARITCDWHSLQRRAGQLGVSRALQLGMSLAHELLGMPLPPGYAAALPPDLAFLRADIIRRLAGTPDQSRPGRLQTLASHMLLRDTWGRRLSEVRHRVRRNLVRVR